MQHIRVRGAITQEEHLTGSDLKLEEFRQHKTGNAELEWKTPAHDVTRAAAFLLRVGLESIMIKLICLSTSVLLALAGLERSDIKIHPC